MAAADDLFPELAKWNDERGVSPIDWLYTTARSDFAAAFAMLLWPTFVEFEDYILREGFSAAHLRGWETQQDITRDGVEVAVNYLAIGDLFSNGGEDQSELVEARAKFVGRTLAEAWTAKLAGDFPDRLFKVELIDDEDDLYLTFFQV